ncbi:MAG TPA: hypothetical protein VGS58_17820 [Candidatus Sulfopaludibacter sp.]|nr:hypothetical protein [Candidatus Sulfopaludibacter sp.]
MRIEARKRPGNLLDAMAHRMRGRTMKMHRADLTGLLGESVTSMVEGARRDTRAGATPLPEEQSTALRATA